MKKNTSALLLSLNLMACGPTDSDPGPGGVSVEDARALDKAAAKLDAETRQDGDSLHTAAPNQ